MTALVNIIIGSKEDLSIVEQTETILKEYEVPYEINILQPNGFKEHLQKSFSKGVQVIVAGTRGNFDFVSQLSQSTSIPVVGIPMRSLNGENSLENVFLPLQQPSKNAIATVALDSGHNAGLLAVQILATTNNALLDKMIDFKENLKQKILKADKELAEIKFAFRTN